MSPLMLDHNFPENPKIRKLPDRAFRLHIAALCYCARNLTDGYVPRPAVADLLKGMLSPERHQSRTRAAPERPGNLTRALVSAGLWKTQKTKRRDGYQIHDFLEYNPKAAEIKQKRADARERMRLLRERQRQNVPPNDDANVDNSSNEQTDVRANVREQSKAKQELRTSKVLEKAKVSGVPDVRANDAIEKQALDRSDPVNRLLSALRAPTVGTASKLREFVGEVPESAFDYARDELQRVETRNDVGLAITILTRLRDNPKATNGKVDFVDDLPGNDDDIPF